MTTISPLEGVNPEASQPEALPCPIENKDSNVMIFNESDHAPITNYSAPLPHGTFILVRCRDIGKYRLSGPEKRLCRYGKWSEEEEVNICTGLNQDFSYDGKLRSILLF